MKKGVKDREYVNDRALGIIERRLNYLNGSNVTYKSKIPGVEDSLKKATALKTKIDEKLKVLAPELFNENGNFKKQKNYDNLNSFVGPTLTYALASAMNGMPGGGGKKRNKQNTKKLNKRGAKTRTGKSRKRRKSKSKSSKSRKNK